MGEEILEGVGWLRLPLFAYSSLLGESVRVMENLPPL